MPCGKDMNAECPWFEMILCHKQEHQVKRLCEDTPDVVKKSCMEPCAKFLQLGSLVVGRGEVAGATNTTPNSHKAHKIVLNMCIAKAVSLGV